MITDGTNWYGVYTGGIAITVTVVIRQASITSRPYIDVTFTATTLEDETGEKMVISPVTTGV